MDSRQKEIIKRLCALSTEVGEHYFHHFAHDCFCSDENPLNFQFEEVIIKFIEDAVREKIKVDRQQRIQKAIQST